MSIVFSGPSILSTDGDIYRLMSISRESLASGEGAAPARRQTTRISHSSTRRRVLGIGRHPKLPLMDRLARVAQTNHKEIAYLLSPSFESRYGRFLCHHFNLALALRYSIKSTPQFQLVIFVIRTVASNFYILLCSLTHFACFLATCCKVMPLLETGRRRTKLDHNYNGPARQGPVRHISPASLTLERIHEQNRASVHKIDAAKAPAPAPGAAARGKPRLLLMGQRR